MKREWLIKLRHEMNLTQEEVATRAGIDRTYYTQIERGTRRPSVQKAKSLAGVLDCSWSLFF